MYGLSLGDDCSSQ